MNPEMHFQRRRLIEALFANRANVVSITRVSFYVNPEIFAARERFRAQVALVRFFPRVNASVFLQLRRTDAAPAAVVAHVGFFPAVRSRVNCEPGGVGEAFAALVADVGALTCNTTNQTRSN